MPALLSRLIYATLGPAAIVRFPSDESVQYSGWDGVCTVAAGSGFVTFVRALGDLFGARSSRARQGVDPTPTASTGWAIQLATSRIDAEAKSDLKRLNAKYASALNGSTIRLHKARIDGGTVYRLRVVGLSKVDAAALCERLKGDRGSCFIVR